MLQNNFKFRVNICKMRSYNIYPAVVCKTPFGVPVDPDVYNINNGSSASIHSHSPENYQIGIISIRLG